MAEKKIDVVIERDVWRANDKGEVIRHRKGSVVSMPVDEDLLDAIASGAVRRAGPEDRR